ncbi:MAG TPA: hypothetical protein DDY98_02885, partial [Ruminococcaceae bacterium]|nr:hypothetical protein [Oscillospiraceae bacterium]
LSIGSYSSNDTQIILTNYGKNAITVKRITVNGLTVYLGNTLTIEAGGTGVVFPPFLPSVASNRAVNIRVDYIAVDASVKLNENVILTYTAV